MRAILAAMLLTASVLSANMSSAAGADPEKITVAYFEEWPTANQVAQAEKWYDEEMGVDLEWRAYDTGVEMAEAMVAGEVDISYSMGVVPFALAVTAGCSLGRCYGRRNLRHRRPGMSDHQTQARSIRGR